jgi:hypothetical protein
LRVQHHPDRRGVRSHCERGAEVADERCDDVAIPRAVRASIQIAAPQPNNRGVNRLLPERAKALSLKGCRLVADLAGRKERLEPIVERARENHPAQYLAALLDGERRLDGGAP